MVQFIVSRFLMATAVYAKFLTGFTLVMEVAGSDHRSTYGTLARAGKPIGYVLVPVLAYYTRDFRYLQLAITLPQILWIYWLTKLPESPRWLLIQGKMDLAQEVVAQAIRVNGLKVDNLEQRLLKIREVLLDSQKENAGTKYGFGDLFKTPIMRKNSLIMCANWFITVFVYYALSLNVQDLGGNLYINFFISGFVEFPAILFCIVAMKQVGRRKLLSLMMITLFLASTAGIPFYFYQFEGSLALRVTMAMIGKFAATCAFAISYVYSSEIYPTVVRQIGVGTNSATSRLGSMTAPFIKELNRATHVSVSLAIFGIFSLLNALLVLSLPETKGCEIPDTIEQVEEGNFDEKSKLHHGETDGNAT
ncbi:Solute carrier family 22 member 3 [Halotydeus destructor]|nr:Solute carrier family 22 member 3 [Halotydeus destructor]